MAVAWSPDGLYLAASVGAKILLFDTRLWEPQAVVEVGAFTHSLAFSPNGTLLASASRDGWVRVWSVPALLQGESGRLPLLALEAHEKGANKVAFSPDGSILASGGNDALARFWDLATGESLGLMIGGTYAVPSIAFAPSGATLAVVNGEVVRLREVGSERITGTLRAKGPLYNVAYSPDGNILAASDLDNAIHLWDPALAFRTGQEQYPQAQVLSGHTGSPGTYRALVWELAFSPDGALLASVGGDGALIVWDLAAGQPGALLQAHSRAATSVAFHPGGRALASGGLDGMLVIWGVMP
jgi:WD40 repeat protein